MLNWGLCVVSSILTVPLWEVTFSRYLFLYDTVLSNFIAKAVIEISVIALSWGYSSVG